MGNDTEHIAIVKRLMVEGEAPLRRAASKKDARGVENDTKRTILRPLTRPSAKRLQFYSHTVLDERFTISQTPLTFRRHSAFQHWRGSERAGGAITSPATSLTGERERCRRGRVASARAVTR